jgi:hypothetical protein
MYPLTAASDRYSRMLSLRSTVPTGAAEYLGLPCGFARDFARDRRALPQLVAAACQVGGLGGVARQLDGLVVRRA